MKKVIVFTVLFLMLGVNIYADKTVNMVLFVGGLFLLLVSMGTYRSPAVALMPDLTPKPLRSKANAVINLMGAVGGVYTLIMIKVLVGGGERPNYYPLFLAVGLLMVVCVAVLFVTIKENKLRKEVGNDVEEEKVVVENKKSEPLPQRKSNKSFAPSL